MVEYMVVTHLIVRKQFDDIAESLVSWLKVNSDGLLVCQHIPDDEEKLIHCHFVINNLSMTVKAVDKHRKLAGLTGADSRYLQVTVKTRLPYDLDKLSVYAIKGSTDLVKMSTYSDLQIEDWASQWVNRVDDDEDKDKKTHWMLIKTVWNKLQNMSGIWDEQMQFNDQGNIRVLNQYGKSVAMQELMNELNLNEVRTSRNELERFYVTLIRNDARLSQELGESILRSVFR